MALLEIKDLHAQVGGREILKGIDLTVEAGEVHAIMGPNGSGKSTLAQVLAGRELYVVTGGEVIYDGQDLLAMSPEDRARSGIFLAFQYPVEIPGVSNLYFLKAALNTIRKSRGEEELDAMDFLDLVREKMKLMEMDQALLNRPVNAGFSGGEKKRNEIFQMAVLEPRLAVLDETDSGLDIDALKLVSGGVNAMRGPERALIVVTHYQRLLNYIVPDFVHVLSDGQNCEIGRQGTGAAARRERLRRAGDPRRGRSALTAVAEQTGAWLAEFTALPAIAPWAQELRETAFQRFAALGFPTTHDEEWRFTNVAPIARAGFKLGLAAGQVTGLTGGAQAGTLEEARQHLGRLAVFDRQAFVALNTAFLENVVMIRVPSGAVIQEPIQIAFNGVAGQATHPRLLLVVGADAHCTFVESYTGAGSYFTNAVTEIVAGDRAVVDHYKMQRESVEAFHVATLAGAVGPQRQFHLPFHFARRRAGPQ